MPRWTTRVRIPPTAPFARQYSSLSRLMAGHPAVNRWMQVRFLRETPLSKAPGFAPRRSPPVRLLAVHQRAGFDSPASRLIGHGSVAQLVELSVEARGVQVRFLPDPHLRRAVAFRESLNGRAPV